MAIKFPKKQQQCLIPKYLLEYATDLQENHPDPSAEWGGSGGEYTAGDGIDITENVISVDNTVALKEDIITSYDDLTDKPDLSVYELKSEAFSGDYNDLTNKPTLFSGDYADLTNKPDLSVYELKSEAFSGDYNDLTNKPTIPTKTSDLTNDSNFIPSNEFNTKPYMFYDNGSSKVIYENTIYYNNGNGYSILTFPIKNAEATIATTDDIPTNVSQLTNDSGFITSAAIPTNVSSFTNDAGYITSSALPTNYVTTDTTQNITGEKTFIGDKRIKFKQNTSMNKLGFTCYDRNNREKAYLEYNPNNDSLCLGRYGAYAVEELGFLSQIQSNTSIQHKLLVPNVTLTASRTDYIPISVNNIKADSEGNITLAIPDVSNYYTKTEVDGLIPTATSDLTNDSGFITSSALTGLATETYVDDAIDALTIPTTATSTSTVTPTTTQLVFTYTDNTTETITLMTGASVSTTTTLS